MTRTPATSMPKLVMTWDALSPTECKIIIEDAAKEAEVEGRNVVLYNAMTASPPAKRKSVEALLSL